MKCFPNSFEFRTFEDYQHAVVEWEESMKDSIWDLDVFHYSSFYKRPKPTISYHSRTSLNAYMNDQNAVLHSNHQIENSKTIINEITWSSFIYSRLPEPDQFTDYEYYKNDVLKWYEKENANFQQQLIRTKNIVPPQGFKSKFYSKEEKKWEIETIHPSRFQNCFNFPVESIKSFPTQPIPPKTEIIKQNPFFEKILKSTVSSHGYDVIDEFLDEVKHSRRRESKVNQEINPFLAEIQEFGISSHILPIPPAIFKEKGKNDQISASNILKILEIDGNLLNLKSCNDIMNYAVDKHLETKDIINMSPKSLFNFAIVIWRFSPFSLPPFRPHFEEVEKELLSSSFERDFIESLWEYSVKEIIISDLISIAKNIQIAKPLYKFLLKEQKILRKQESNQIFRSLTEYFEKPLNFEIYPLSIVDILVGNLHTNETTFFDAICSSDLCNFNKIQKFLPESLIFKYIQQYPHIGRAILRREEFCKLEYFKPNIYMSLFSLQYPIAPADLITYSQWYGNITCYSIYNLAEENSPLYSRIAVTATKFAVRLYQNAKNFEDDKFDGFISACFGMALSVIHDLKNNQCKADVITMVAKILKIAEDLDKFAIIFLEFLDDNEYIVAHSAYKVLKSIVLQNFARFEEIWKNSEETLTKIFKNIHPAVSLDFMKLLARFIQKHVPAEVKANGFLGVPQYVPYSLTFFMKVLNKVDLNPKQVTLQMKNMQKTAIINVQSSRALSLLRYVFLRRPTIARFVLQ